jgi:hypothetical protein
MASDTDDGWTNYVTWRVNHEIFNGQDAKDLGIHRMDEYEAAQYLKSYVEGILQQDCWTIDGDHGKGITLDYALAFISDVYWHEIAKHLKEKECWLNTKKATK